MTIFVDLHCQKISDWYREHCETLGEKLDARVFVIDAESSTDQVEIKQTTRIWWNAFVTRGGLIYIVTKKFPNDWHDNDIGMCVQAIILDVKHYHDKYVKPVMNAWVMP